MKMKWSLYLGQVSGIKLFVHWTFLILIGWILLMYFQAGHGLSQGLIGVGFILTLFLCVVLHELGHALTARRFSIRTKNITLLPIGGVSNMERMPEKPGQELLVSIMGPLVNVVIALGLFLYLNVTGGIPTAEELTAGQEENEYGLITGSNFLFNLMLVNIMLVLFNLLPAFPMDGGRMLRALFSYRFERAKATRIAARIGQVMAIVFVIAGFYVNFWLIFIGIFIFLGAGGEAAYENTKSILSKYKVKDVLMTNYKVLSPQLTIGKAIQALLDGQEQEFLVGEGNTVQGVLTRNNIYDGLNAFGKEVPISQVMRKDFVTIRPEMELKEVYQKLMSNESPLGPVYENGELLGIIDRENISELVMMSREEDGEVRA